MRGRPLIEFLGLEDMTPTELKSWRKIAGLSQAGLAMLLGIDKQTVSRWERGDRGIPPFLHLALESLEWQDQFSTGQRMRWRGRVYPTSSRPAPQP